MERIVKKGVIFVSGAAYILVVIGILIAKCVGFFRDIVFASVFGATELTDIYFQIFSMASLVFTGIGGALSTLVIKNLNKPANSAPDAQKKYASAFITKTALILIPATAVMYLFAPLLVKILLPGLNPSLYGQAIKIMYIMLPSCIFVVLAYIISGILQNCRIFFITSVMSLPFNAIIILSLLFDGVDITTVSIVTTIGWLLHIVIQLPSFYSKGYRLFSMSPVKNSGDKNPEMLYIFISSMMFQFCLMIDKAFVSFDSGAATTINYASNLFITISSVFVVAMSNVAYPSICKNYEAGQLGYVKKLIGYIITVLFAIFVPFILTVSCFGEDIIRLLYERGEFTPELTVTTASLFTVYVLGIFGYVCQELFNKVLYLAGKYKYTVFGTVAVIILNALLDLFAVKSGGVIGVALTTTLLFAGYSVLIAFAMVRVTGNYFDKRLGRNLLKILLGGILALGVYFLTRNISLLPEKIAFILPLGLCGITYIAVLFFTGILKTVTEKQSKL